MIRGASTQAERVSGINLPLKFYLKLIISAGLLAWVLSRVPLPSLWNAVNGCGWPWIVLSFAVVNACMFVSALKWQLLLNAQHIRLSFTRVLSFYYVGLFANNFLPSSIGGDAMRIYDAARASGKAGEAAASVVMERLLASLALAFTAAVAVMLRPDYRGNGLFLWLTGGIAVFCLAATVILFAWPFNENGPVGRWLCRLSRYKKEPQVLFGVMLLSFLFQGLLVVSNIFIFKALGVDIPLPVHFFYIPLIMAATMLPASVNGIGIREGMYAMLYGLAGVEPATAVACSLLFWALVTVASLAGGIILAARK